MKLKKKVLVGGSIVLVAAITTAVVLVNNHYKNSVSHITFTEDSLNKDHQLEIEYSNGEISPMEYVVTNDKVAVSSSPEKISLNAVGETTVTYTLQQGSKSNQIQCEFVVKDTKAPVITFFKDTVDTDNMDAFDAQSNIQSVEDPVDGSLMYLESEPEKIDDVLGKRMYETGWYTIVKNENSVSVHACDIHGNVSEASYTVNISAVPTEQPTDTLLYSYRPVDLAGIDDPFNWNQIDRSDWYYAECSYLSGKYATAQEALQDVVDHENANGNTANVENEARIFCVTDAEGNVLYYQAGFEE